MSVLTVIPLLLCLLAGLAVGIAPKRPAHQIHVITAAVLLVNLGLAVWIALLPADALQLTLFHITKELPIAFRVDGMGKLFSLLIAFVWLMAGVAAFEYMHHEGAESRFFGFYLAVAGVLSALCYSGNLLTYYLFFEMMSLLSMPLVLHSLSHDAIMAALKYLFYSMAGAFLMLFGLFLFASRGSELVFTPGGCLEGLTGGTTAQIALFLMIVGFGTKAGMFPMHGWLPTAHPVAPAPASAVLSGVITKAGVLGIIRVVYYLTGPEVLRGTWVQTAWLVLTLITVFMGSMMAYQENVLKKRMAYSTVSQVSYVLFGLALLHPAAFTGAVLHVVFHSLVKDTLFLSAGAIILKTGRTKVSELAGIGRKMPVTMWCFTLVSITLVGIPPTSAFLSKWYLAVGSLETGIPVISWLGPVVLLISALLTAGYLLTISIKGFFPGPEEAGDGKNCEPTWRFTLPMITMTVLAVGLGIWAGPLLRVVSDLAALLFAGGGIG